MTPSTTPVPTTGRQPKVRGGLVGAGAAVAVVIYRRRQPRRDAGAPADTHAAAATGPVPVELLGTRPAERTDRT